MAAVLVGGCGDNRMPGSKADVSLANLNFLHGTQCPADTGECRRAERLDLALNWLQAVGCPDLVTMQEITTEIATLLERIQPACPFEYHVAWQSKFGVDDQLILSRFPVRSVELSDLLGGFRTVTHAQVDHPLGMVDVFTTHLAAEADGGDWDCGPDCPEECVNTGATTRRACQAVQLQNYVAARNNVGLPALVSGDLNTPPTSSIYQGFIQQGWQDVFSRAGNRECDAAVGSGCTSGEHSDQLSRLESPSLGLTERIDYVYFVGGDSSCVVDDAADADGDGLKTGLFADRPNPFVPNCGPRPLDICWPSDHAGILVDLNCKP